MGYYLYRAVILLTGESRTGRLVGGFAGAWGSVLVASVVCAIELAISGRWPLGVALPAMVGVHALIGIGEGLITAAVLGLVTATRVELLKLQKV